MGGTLFIVWGVALAAIGMLGGLLVWTVQRGTPSEPQGKEVRTPDRTGQDVLLFYYAQEIVRGTSQGEVIVRIPGRAWEPAWQHDLLRLEVSAEDPPLVGIFAEWGAVEVLAAYALRAYRMTRLGTDVEIERFAAPVDLFLTAEHAASELRLAVFSDGRWRLAPPAALSAEVIEEIEFPAGCSWAAASLLSMGKVCVVHVAKAVETTAEWSTIDDKVATEPEEEFGELIFPARPR